MPDDAGAVVAPIFTPFSLRVMSPMCMYTADDGTVGDFQVVHLGSRAMGGAGLVLSVMTDVSPEGRISPGCAGMYKPAHVEPWRRVVEFVHGHTDAKIGVQLGHAGRKAATKLAWEGGTPLDDNDSWEILAPSAIPFGEGSRTPRQMDRADMDKVRDDFARAAGMADEAGFDMIELHFAHGYLLSSFISPISNTRTDDYGGPLENRMRFPLEVFRAARQSWPDDKPISARISAFDWIEGGTTGDDAVEIGRMAKQAGLDILTVSTGNVVAGARPDTTGLFQTPFSDRVRNEAGIPTMTVGNISGPEEINAVIAEGRADLCVLAKGHLYDPYFARHAARAGGRGAGLAEAVRRGEILQSKLLIGPSYRSARATDRPRGQSETARPTPATDRPAAPPAGRNGARPPGRATRVGDRSAGTSRTPTWSRRPWTSVSPSARTHARCAEASRTWRLSPLRAAPIAVPSGLTEGKSAPLAARDTMLRQGRSSKTSTLTGVPRKYGQFDSATRQCIRPSNSM